MAMNPPKLRDWKRGQPQIGAFLRTATGAVIELVNDKAGPDEVNLVRCLLFGPEALSDAFKVQLAAEIERLASSGRKPEPKDEPGAGTKKPEPKDESAAEAGEVT